MEEFYIGDCLHVLPREIDPGTINLIITSPPYADARKHAYGGIPVDQYVDWFMPRACEFKRVLSPDGSFILNIKEKVVGGQRSTYVLRLILSMVESGWLWTEEYIWTKPNAMPGYWRNRFRDAWERCLHFTPNRNFYMDQKAVQKPVGDWAKNRLQNLGEGDLIRHESATGSKLGRDVSKWVGRDLVYPSNVLNFPAECGNRKHPAAFPENLPDFFIKLFSRPGDTVLDPFVGSGTTAVVAKRLGRNCIGIDLKEEYVNLSKIRVAKESSYNFAQIAA